MDTETTEVHSYSNSNMAEDKKGREGPSTNGDAKTDEKEVDNAGDNEPNGQQIPGVPADVVYKQIQSMDEPDGTAAAGDIPPV